MEGYDSPQVISDYILSSDPEVSRLNFHPHSLEAEQSVLGGLLISSDAWEAVSDQINSDDFYRPNHRQIFREIALLAEENNPIDIITLADKLQAQGVLETVGGLAYISELAEKTPSVSNIKAYAAVIRERAILRNLIQTSQEIAESGFNPEGRSSSDIVDEAQRKIMRLSDGEQGFGGLREIKPLLTSAIDRIEELYDSGSDITGVSTGFKDLDNMTSGLQRSDLVVVAGRPSMGKTAFAMNLVEHAALNQDKPVLVFSLEMSSESLIMRMLASLGRIDQKKIRSGKLEKDDWPKLSTAAGKLQDLPLFIDDSSALTPTEIRTRARKIAKESGELGLVMVDYMQLMQVAGSSEGRVAEISEISRNLKAIAKEFNCPMIALSQLNRALEQRPNKRPQNADLRESGAIEQDADVILFIYRDEVYNEESLEKGTAEIIIGKQRNGPIGTCKLAFLGEYTRFENLARSSYRD